MQQLFEGRKTAFKALVGSHNYNLNDETSDKDYKYFVLPTFDDLYENKMYSLPSQVSAEMDFDVHDVRKIPNLFYKSNINFVEVLYSTEIDLCLDLTQKDPIYSPLPQIFAMRKKIARMNVPYFFHACVGMHYRKMSALNKGTKGTQHLVSQFGYDTKQALHAYRVLDFLERFYYNDFNDFKKAITYDGVDRDFMFSIKQGVYTEQQYRLLVAEKLEKVLTLKESYDRITTDEETYQMLKRLTKDLVRFNI